MKIKVEVEITRRYEVEVDADSERDAAQKVSQMGVYHIEAHGRVPQPLKQNITKAVLDATQVK